MKVKKGDFVVFEQHDGTTVKGIVIDVRMGIADIFSQDGAYQKMPNEISENKGNVFEVMGK